MSGTPWAGPPWLIATLILVPLAAVLIYRSWRRGEEKRQQLSESEREARQETSERRGRRVEDVLTLAVASAAAYLSASGLRLFGRELMGLQAPLDWLPFISLDVAALVCGLRARRRARRGEGPGLSGGLVWVLIGISAGFSAHEGEGLVEAIARGVWPIISGVLFELGSLEERKAAKRKRSGRQWLDRKLDAVRMLHPIEWLRVQLALAADETISQTEATRRVRIERAGYRLYRLRQLLKAQKAGELRTFLFFGNGNGRVMRADSRAQKTQAAVPTQDLPLVLIALQRRVNTRSLAAMSYKDAQGAEKALDSLISTREDRTGTDSADGTDGRTGTPDADRTEVVLPSRTGTPAIEPVPVHGTDGRTGTPDDAVPAVPTARTGTTSDDRTDRTGTTAEGRTARTGTAGEDRTDRTGEAVPVRETQVTAGTSEQTVPAEATPQGESGTEGLSEGAIVESLRYDMKPDGKSFYSGGVHKLRAKFGIGGTGTMTKLMEEARELGPLGESGTASEAPADEGSVPEAPAVQPAVDFDAAFDIEARFALAGPSANETD